MKFASKENKFKFSHLLLSPVNSNADTIMQTLIGVRNFGTGFMHIKSVRSSEVTQVLKPGNFPDLKDLNHG
ncbi:hypothetical protein VCRA2123O444_90083 [Vibrio crassostreae]|uniref:Uncharacterized protein n=1 Tax=Vibrio crassostreae TaxID=246167 RepID=A0A822MYS0_9VIBR|nr:hypothetical protein VCRA2117O428_110084 [Vibrio crassostreae]CAK2218817.1 hypothetical protein VCRA2119O431_90083 [Vibrio crassostreae]CAK2527371.1 hypothetical protein VCRA2116O426_100083 [Vibrio crassostreae]CAK2571302.1 hypothetical protein VCRA2133O453_100083 [Vibrio crassostreae]CAK2590579.1 hypothetical protein VCRA2126O448_110084 [Vibrio crassostreae]